VADPRHTSAKFDQAVQELFKVKVIKINTL